MYLPGDRSDISMMVFFHFLKGSDKLEENVFSVIGYYSMIRFKKKVITSNIPHINVSIHALASAGFSMVILMTVAVVIKNGLG